MRGEVCHVCRAERAPVTNLLVCALRYLTPGVASPPPESNECLCPTDEQKTTKEARGAAASEHRAAAPQRAEGAAVSGESTRAWRLLRRAE